MAEPRQPITYAYEVEGHKVEVSRQWVGEGYARNGNAHNPTQYYKWASRVDGLFIAGSCSTRANAYEYARAHIQKVAFHINRLNPNKSVGERMFWLVADEMKANYRGKGRVG